MAVPQQQAEDPAGEEEMKKMPASPNGNNNKNLGLSELSKQLRVLQAKNQAQSSDIDRLERQIRILCDLKGVNIEDLRDALKNACKGEAHADLQSRIASLQAQLVVNAYSTPNGSSMNSDDFLKEAASRQIATLQLRVGELEEVEEALRSEISTLYQSLSEEKTKSTRLDSLCSQQKEQLDKNETLIGNQKTQIQSLQEEGDAAVGEIDGLKKRMEELEAELQVGKDRMRAFESQTIGDNNGKDEAKKLAQELSEAKIKFKQLNQKYKRQKEKTAEAEASVIEKNAHSESLQKEKDTVQVDMDALVKKFQDVKVEVQVEHDKVTLLESQAEAREKESQLRNDQAKSRFKVQDDRIYDLEQQLSSLYTAFEMLRQEHSLEQKRRSTIQSDLCAADLQVARLEEKDQKRQSENSVPKVVHATTTTMVTPPNSPLGSPTLDSSPSGSNVASGYSSVKSPPPKRNSTGKLAAGYMFKRDKNILKGWKKRYFLLFGSEGTFHLSYSDSPKEHVKGTITILKGLSSVRQATEFQSKPHALALHVNPNDPQAPVLYAATSSRKELEEWLAIIRSVTEGPVDLKDQEQKDLELALQLQRELM